MERLRSNIRYCDMIAIDPPIRLEGYPSELIDSTEAAAKFIERHDGAFDIEGASASACSPSWRHHAAQTPHSLRRSSRDRSRLAVVRPASAC
jgi:hypothetical protein